MLNGNGGQVLVGGFLILQHIHIFDSLCFAEPLRDRIRARLEQMVPAAETRIV